MRRALHVLLATLVLGCASAGYRGPTPGYLADATKTKYRIVGWLTYTSYQAWVNSAYFRVIDDPFTRGQVNIAVNELRQGCVTPDDIFALSPRDMACPSGWRFARP